MRLRPRDEEWTTRRFHSRRPRSASCAQFGISPTLRYFADSDVGRKAKSLFAALVALLCAENGLNVVNSFVNRNFTTAIAGRDMAGFIGLAISSVSVFAGATVVSVTARVRGGTPWLSLSPRPLSGRGGIRGHHAIGDGVFDARGGALAHRDPVPIPVELRRGRRAPRRLDRRLRAAGNRAGDRPCERLTVTNQVSGETD